MKYTVKIYTTVHTNGYHWSIRPDNEYSLYSGYAYTIWGARREVEKTLKKLQKHLYETEYEVEL